MSKDMIRNSAGHYEGTYKGSLIMIFRQGRTWAAQIETGLVVDRCLTIAEALSEAKKAFDWEMERVKK